MKKPTLFVVIILLIGLFAGCQSKETVYQTNFKHKEYNFSFRIPKEWEGKYRAVESETENTGALIFEYSGYSDKAGKYQPFFAIDADRRFYGGRKEEDNITERSGIYYFILIPKNLIADKSKSKEYEELCLSKDEIKSRFFIGNK